VITECFNRLSFDDDELIRDISKRAAPKIGTCANQLGVALTVCHIMEGPLNLEKLANFDCADMVHDVSGIYYRLDIETGKLNDCFWPRCGARKQ